MSELELKNKKVASLVSTDTIDGEIATLNLGPTHPATHGIFQNILQIDGEQGISTAHLKNWLKDALIIKLLRLPTG